MTLYICISYFPTLLQATMNVCVNVTTLVFTVSSTIRPRTQVLASRRPLRNPQPLCLRSVLILDVIGKLRTKNVM